ncbi:oxygen-independent coproporphyrinogenIII oxidase [Monoraphidium neglectum]|uniref:Oxygen-independent coproporphyrinogenIII oxidase n=1 Tax=Monoraphidium neglectum TaxID=145388 RepID=A0A0D2MEU9_9CHLO|nr:oxygen-independent coproporphyrinogenIII oxidase [Monoraphidium neglectum]KIY99261.1 oxygen-independent coproporphyrinogenIII oxidase [Monoraphidium neglectum]|eukprot:XP_013898281.1 oxygen-independent coproporphyrinogenIII oxidase [Monoraphidium neglectum]
MADYVELLLSEIDATAVLNDPDRQPLQTVYFGGGTPSLVPPHLLARILDALRRRYGLARGAEVSIEADPGTFDAGLLAEYKQLGFTRLSVGVQSFQEDLLQTCGRAHTLADARAALKAVAAAGFQTWSLDLMSGLPGLTRAGWRDTLAEAVAAGAPHISVYDLQVEEGTPFARRYSPGAAPLPADDDAAGMYADAAAALTSAGYEHYEVSSYALPGHRSRHNQVYWKLLPYYAFGVGAASYLAGRRYSRPKELGAYEEWARGFAAAAAAAAAAAGAAGGAEAGGSGGGGIPGADLMPETQEERLLDSIMLGLRTADGLDLRRLATDYGQEAAKKVLPVLRRHECEGLVELRGAQGGTALASSSGRAAAAGGGGAVVGAAGADAVAVEWGDVVSARLTDPEGFLLSNMIISDIFAVM